MKILILGSVGSGKTTLAKKLSQNLKIKSYEIDSIVHDDQKKQKRTANEQKEIIKKINQNNDWIIEGTLRDNYCLLDYATTIIFIALPKIVIYYHILKRYLKQKLGFENGNYEVNLKMLKKMFKWSIDFNYKSMYNLLMPFQEKLVVLKNKKAIKAYNINRIKRG